jgi:hypothetical protein
MTWLSLANTNPRSCCDVLCVRARILAFNEPDRALADEGIDVLLVRSPFAFPLDAEPEEVEPVAQVHYLGFSSRKLQSHRCQHLGDLFA